MNTRTINLYGAKGGVGTSTVAALVALTINDDGAGPTVALQAADGDHDDLQAILGVPASSDYVRLDGSDDSFVNVIDHCAWPPETHNLRDGDATYLVIRGCYLALRRVLAQGYHPDGIILVAEPNRSLGGRDAVEILGAPVVATLAIDPAIARAIDAGILYTRMPRTARIELPTAVRA